MTHSTVTIQITPTSLPSIRLDGLYGDAAVLLDVVSTGVGVIARSRDYSLLSLEEVKQALSHPPDQVSAHAESGMSRTHSTIAQPSP